MKTRYIVYEQVTTPASRENGEYESQEEFTSGTASVKDTIKDLSLNLGIRPRDVRQDDPWFCSTEPPHDRDYYKEGIERFYSLHFPGLSPRALQRVDQMLAIRWWQTPRVL